MKTLIYTLLIFVAPVLSYAQTLPNPGFENWTTDSVNGYMEPTGWNTSNQQTGSLPGGTTVAQNTDKHGGNYAAEMATVGLGSPATYYAGYITNGTFKQTGSNISIVGGTPFSYTPDSLSFYYKYQSGDRDSGRVLIYFYKRVNATTRLLVGFGQMNLDTTSTYKQANVSIRPDTLHTAPDSVLVLFQSCRDLAHPKNGQLLVDDIGFKGNSGITETPADIAVEIYPNPANDFLSINTPDNEPAVESISFYTVDGKLQRMILNEQKTHHLMLNNYKLPAGTYFARLQWADGRFVNRSIIMLR